MVLRMLSSSHIAFFVSFCRVYKLSLRTADRLGHVLLHQRRHDALDVRPLPDDQRVASLTGSLDEAVGIVVRVADTDDTGGRLVRVAVPGRELLTIAEQQPEVDLIGAMGVGGMTFRLDVGRIIVQDVEDEVRLVLVGADDASIAGNVVGDEGVRAHALLQTEVFAAVPGIDGEDLGFDALAVAAGVFGPADVVPIEHRQGGGGIRDGIVGRVQRLGPQEVARRRRQCGVSEARNLRHLPKPHVGSHGHDAGEDMTRIGVLLDVTARTWVKAFMKLVLPATNRSRSAIPIPGNWP
jgi:hypothetical protein